MSYKQIDEQFRKQFWSQRLDNHHEPELKDELLDFLHLIYDQAKAECGFGAAIIHVCPKCEFPEVSCKCLSPDEFQSRLSKAKAEQREETLKKITPALDDFSAAANLMIDDGLLKKTGQEIHENIGYIKSCFMSTASAIRQEGE